MRVHTHFSFCIVAGTLLGLGVVGCGHDDGDRDVVYVREREPAPKRVTVIERPIEPRNERVVIVKEAPPAAVREVRPRAPGRDLVWVDGCWRHDGRRYVWSPGRYETARPRQVYVNPRWEKVREGYRFHEGFWKAER